MSRLGFAERYGGVPQAMLLLRDCDVLRCCREVLLQVSCVLRNCDVFIVWLCRGLFWTHAHALGLFWTHALYPESFERSLLDAFARPWSPLDTCKPSSIFFGDKHASLGLLVLLVISLDLILTSSQVVEVFIHDPLFRWALSHGKAQRRQQEDRHTGGQQMSQC